MVATRVKISYTETPQSLTEMNLMIGKIGEVLDCMDETEKVYDSDISQLKKQCAEEVAGLTKERDQLIRAVYTYAHKNREVIIPEGKSRELSCGVFGWRTTPGRVSVTGKVRTIIAKLKKQKKAKFVRTVEELNKAALLKDRPQVDGISYDQRDEFFVTPETTPQSRHTTVAIDAR